MDFQLIHCPACGNKCSSQASSCPSCGHPFVKSSGVKSGFSEKISNLPQSLRKQNNSSRAWMIATVILAIVMLGAGFYAYRILYGYPSNPNPVFNQQTAGNQRNSLAIKAAIVYNFGGAQPVARTTFYLSRIDLENAASKAKIEITTSAPSLWAFEESVNSQLGKKETSRFVKAIKPFIVSTATTDFNGDALFESVPIGSYYLIGIAPTRSGMAVWNLPVKTGMNQTILLDQNNAAVAE